MPANAALLVIASPQADVQPAEVGKIRRYLDAGGNLLWLIDPEPLRGLQPIAEVLGLVLTPGTVVDPTLRAAHGPARVRRRDELRPAPDHRGFPLQHDVPVRAADRLRRKRGLAHRAADRSPQRGWVEVGRLDDKPTFDARAICPAR